MATEAERWTPPRLWLIGDRTASDYPWWWVVRPPSTPSKEATDD